MATTPPSVPRPALSHSSSTASAPFVTPPTSPRSRPLYERKTSVSAQIEKFEARTRPGSSTPGSSTSGSPQPSWRRSPPPSAAPLDRVPSPSKRAAAAPPPVAGRGRIVGLGLPTARPVGVVAAAAAAAAAADAADADATATPPSKPRASVSSIPRSSSGIPRRSIATTPGAAPAASSASAAGEITTPSRAGPSRKLDPVISVSQATPPKPASTAGSAVATPAASTRTSPTVRRKGSSQSLAGTPRKTSGIPVPAGRRPSYVSTTSTSPDRRPSASVGSHASPARSTHTLSSPIEAPQLLRASSISSASASSTSDGPASPQRVSVDIPRRTSSATATQAPPISPRHASLALERQSGLPEPVRRTSRAPLLGEPVSPASTGRSLASKSSFSSLVPKRAARALNASTSSSASVVSVASASSDGRVATRSANAQRSPPMSRTATRASPRQSPSERASPRSSPRLPAGSPSTRSPRPDQTPRPDHSPRRPSVPSPKSAAASSAASSAPPRRPSSTLASPRPTPVTAPRPQSTASPRPAASSPMLTASPRPGTRSSPRASPRASPRPDRKSPGLSITTPSQPASPALPAVPRHSAENGRPSPPIPAKSPLRAASSSGMQPLGRAQKPRTGSRESTLAVAGTPVSATGSVPGSARSDATSLDRPGSSASIPSIPSLDSRGQARRPSPGPASAQPSPADAIRFTALTVPSVYSDGSAPTSARSWVDETVDMTPESEGVTDNTRRESRIDSFGWGKRRDTLPEPVRRTSNQSRSDLATDKTLPSVPPAMSPVQSVPPSPSDRRLHSPSMPHLGSPPSKAARTLGIDVPTLPRSATSPMSLLPAAALEDGPPLPGSASASTASLSKRAHLIREIATTERAHAQDLALIRDAYVARYLRPTSQHSALTNGDSSAISPSASDLSHRSSTYTFQTAETKRSSGRESPDSPWASLYAGPVKSPREALSPEYFASTASASTTSLQTPQPSPRVASGPTSSTAVNRMAPPVGRPLHPADVKAVFLNIDQLVGIAEELATGFERAIGDDEGRSGESGTDRIGEIFVQILPRLRPLYAYYCSRQSQASTRLVELQADAGHAAYLDDCWSRVKTRTHAWNLDSMLIKPVQRVTKYPLLFDDLLALTTPVHADYFAIRGAAEGARALAVEIDDAKRRKDVISSVIARKSPSAASRDAAGKFQGLKRFKKEKMPGVAGGEAGPPPDIAPASQALLKDMVAKLEEGDQCVRRVGKEILNWTASAKAVLVAEGGMVESFLRAYTLDGAVPLDRKGEKGTALRALVEDTVYSAWEALNHEVRNSIMVALGKLLESARNPRTVIAKRDSKAADYGRYLAQRDAKRTIERALVQSAADFVAMHTQLVDELPIFLEGYMRVFDMAVVAFAHAQSRFHGAVRDKLFAYQVQFAVQRKPSTASNVVDLDDDPTSPRAIVKAWHDAWHPYDQAMERFESTRATRAAASRVASFNLRHDASRPGSVSPGLRHSPSVASTRSRHRHDASIDSTTTRQRSTSLIGDDPPSPVKLSRFGMLRRNSQLAMKQKASAAEMAKSASSGAALAVPSSPSRPRLSRPASMTNAAASESTNRYSFGLPRIPTDPNRPMFEGLGFSPKKPTLTASSSLRSVSDPHKYDAASVAGLGLGEIDRREVVQVPHPYARQSSPQPAEVDASEGWRNEKVLYQCACVAEFDPFELGNRRYRGLRFLPIEPGELVDVFHEVGRIDELPSFPYPQVGVDNDGVLIGRAEGGAIGLVICSFLEPLRED